ncbi:MAG TPA: ATPase, partial [Bacteroidaceae bacterium]|nr:ATPase [Bacteroidaceae bacterium]
MENYLNMPRLIIFCLCILLSVADLFSQNILDFDNLSIDDGFSSSKANVIFQDSKGFMWIGTWNGLNKYDGYKCEILRPGYHDTTKISDREILALLEDHQGKIWIGTTSGLNCLNPMTNDLKRYEFQNRIISLFEDEHHLIWVGTWNGGLFRLDPATGETENYFGSEIISDICLDSKNNFWIATYYGLINFDRESTGYTRYLPDENHTGNSISHSVVTCIEESEDGTLWVGTWGGGLNKVLIHQNSDSLNFTHFRARDGENPLSSDVIYRLHYDKYSNLWIGTWDAGLNLLDPEQQKYAPEKTAFESFLSDLSDQYSVSGNNITALFVDRSGVLWVGSSKIDRANIIRKGITRFKTTGYSDGARSVSSVRSIASREDYLWVGTTNELKLYQYRNNDYRLVRDMERIAYTYRGTRYISNSVLVILASQSGLWLGTDDAGLIFYPEPSSIELYHPGFIFFNTETEPGLPGNKVSQLVESKKYPGVIWIGTQQTGFAKFIFQDGEGEIEIFRAGNDNRSLSDDNIRAIVEDHDGLVWIGTQKGLNCFNPETGTFTKFFYSETDLNSINDNVINVIFEDASFNLWIGTNLGLNKKQVLQVPDDTGKVCFKGYP